MNDTTTNQRLVDPTHKMLYLLTGKNPSEIRRRDKSIKFPLKVSAIKNVNPWNIVLLSLWALFGVPLAANDVTVFFIVF